MRSLYINEVSSTSALSNVYHIISMNCTEDPSFLAENGFRSSFAFWTLGVISIILSIFAIVGNVVNLFVLTRCHMRSTMSTLLVSLAWADLVPPTVVSLNSVFFYHLLPHLHTSSTFLTTHLIARAVFDGLANIFTTFSNWLIVIITTFRLIVVQKPLLAKNYCNRRSARFASIVILIFSILLNLPLFLYTSIRVYCTDDGRIKYYGPEVSSLVQTPLFAGLFYPTMVIMSLIIPWLTCFLIWLFLMRALHSAQTQLTTKTMHTTFTNDRKQDTYFRITLMIVCVLSVYMVCRSAHLFEVIQMFITPWFTSEQQARFAQIRIKLFCISNIMLTINHGANFYIYSINPKFRLTLKLYIRYYFRRCRSNRRRTLTLFHLRRKKTNDSLDGLSPPNDIRRSLMFTQNHPRNLNHRHHHNRSLRKPQKYINEFVEPNSNNENSEKSYNWNEIEQRLKDPRQSYY